MKISQSNQSVILKVPFISWEDERLPVGEMNASDPASYAMVIGYWRNEVDELFADDDAEFLNDWMREKKQGKSFDDLKPYIDDRIPIIVGPTALTPFAHPISALTFELGVKQYPDTLEQTSGSLDGLFVPLDYPDLSERPDSMGLIREDFLWSSKVVVGYDDSHGDVYLHDPTFGPYWKVSYDDFEKMWEVGSRSFQVFHPSDYDAVSANKSISSDNITRSPNHQATECYIFGYALSSTGRNEEAEEQLRHGLEIEGMGEGYRFLLNLELGMVRFKNKDIEGAITYAKEASKILPQHHASWFLLANLYRLRKSDKVKIILYTMKAKFRRTSPKGSAELPPNMAYHEFFCLRR